MTTNLNYPAIDARPLTEADLQTASDASAAWWSSQFQPRPESKWRDTVPVEQPDAAHAAGEQDDPPRARFSAWSPAVNVILIVMAFTLAVLFGALNKHKYAVIVLLVAVLPLVMVAAAQLFARLRG